MQKTQQIWHINLEHSFDNNSVGFDADTLIGVVRGSTDFC